MILAKWEKPLHSSRLPSWQSLQACMSRLLSEKEYDCDEEEEDLADVPDRPRDLHYLRGMYRPFLRCSQNHQHIHHHRCIVAMLNDGSTSNMICFILPQIISRKTVVFIFWTMNTIISTLFISSTDLPRNEVLAGVPFDKKWLENYFSALLWSCNTYRTMPNYRWSLSTSHQQHYSFNATIIIWRSVSTSVNVLVIFNQIKLRIWNIFFEKFHSLYKSKNGKIIK